MGVEPPRKADFAAIRAALAAGQRVSDRRFDFVYPREVRRASEVHWSPVRVAALAARFLAASPRDGTIVDVGSGVGKFCIVAATVTTRRVRGVEHRARYVDVARAAGAAFGVDVAWEVGTVEDVRVGDVAGLYLYNPFFENTCPPEDHLDASVELSDERYARDVLHAERLLHEARPGTRLAIYCGFGGAVPEAWERLTRDVGAGVLELYEKRG